MSTVWAKPSGRARVTIQMVDAPDKEGLVITVYDVVGDNTVIQLTSDLSKVLIEDMTAALRYQEKMHEEKRCWSI